MLPLLRPFSRGSVPQWNNALELIQKRTMAAPAAPTTAVEGRGHGDATPDRKELIQRVLHIRRTTRMSRAGKVRSMYAMVVVGNGNGGAGYGEGKSTDLGGAVQKAVKRAQRDMMVINRYDNRTIFGTIVHKYVGSEITLRPAPPGKEAPAWTGT